MLSARTQKRLANLILCIAEGEKKTEMVRQVLAEQPMFEPYTAFRRLDQNRTDQLISDDLLEFLQDNKKPVTSEELHYLFHRVDANQDGLITYPDFVKFTLPKEDLRLSHVASLRESYYLEKNMLLPYEVEWALSRVFEQEIENYRQISILQELLLESSDYDALEAYNCVQPTSVKNVASFLAKTETPISNDEIQAFFRAADLDEDGRVSYSEFLQLVRKLDIPNEQLNSQSQWNKPNNQQNNQQQSNNKQQNQEQEEILAKSRMLEEELAKSRERVVELETQLMLRESQEQIESELIRVKEREEEILRQEEEELDRQLRRSEERMEEIRRNDEKLSKKLDSGVEMTGSFGQTPPPATKYQSALKQSGAKQARSSPYQSRGGKGEGKFVESRIYETPKKQQHVQSQAQQQSTIKQQQVPQQQQSKAQAKFETSQKYETPKYQNSQVQSPTAANQSGMKGNEESQLVLALKEQINLLKEIEESKIQLAFRVDFHPSKAFNQLDKYGRLQLSKLELELSLNDNYVYPTREQLQLFFNHYCQNTSFLSYRQFLGAFLPQTEKFQALMLSRDEKCEMSEKTKQMVRDLWKKHFEISELLEDVRQRLARRVNFNLNSAFQTLDDWQKGFLTIEQFRQLFQKYGVMVSGKDLEGLMRQYDHNQDGKVSYSEFMKEMSPNRPLKF